MQVKNTYYWFKQALSPEVCQKIIDKGTKQIDDEKSKGKSVSATTFGDNHKQGLEEKGLKAVAQADKTIEQVKTEMGISDADVDNSRYIRDSEVTWMNDQWLYDTILPYVDKANQYAGWRYNYDYCESFQFTVYEPDGFYNWHRDGGSDHYAKYKRYIEGISPPRPSNRKDRLPPGYVKNNQLVGKIRKLSMTINLNEPGDYDGGNLKFDFGSNREDGHQIHEVEEIRPQGSIIVFPSYQYHCVTPVTRGTRYSLVLWTLGQPFK